MTKVEKNYTLTCLIWFVDYQLVINNKE